MSEPKKAKREKGSWAAGLKSEFKKIIWLDRATLGKQTVAVVIVTVILGIIIAVVDFLVQHGVDFLVGL